MLRVLLKCKQVQDVLAGTDQRFLLETAHELEEAWEDVNLLEPLFLELLQAGVRSLGLPPESTLRELAEACSEPWAFVFTQIRSDFLATATEIEQVSALNRATLSRRQLALQSARDILGGGASRTYDASGSPAASSGRGMHIVDVRS